MNFIGSFFIIIIFKGKNWHISKIQKATLGIHMGLRKRDFRIFLTVYLNAVSQSVPESHLSFQATYHMTLRTTVPEYKAKAHWKCRASYTELLLPINKSIHTK